MKNKRKLRVYVPVLVVCFSFIMLLVGCNKSNITAQQNNSLSCKQELTKSKDWVRSWRTCSGDSAIKKDGSLWQFGRVGGCDWGQMLPLDPDTGKPIYKTSYVYHLEPKKIGDGFDGAKIINAGYRVYVIKKDGTLWGWGEGFRKKAMLLSQSQDWVDFGVKWAGNGCCAHDVGLKKDGSVWRFPEFFDYSKKSPIDDLKRVGKQKGWDKIILNCCTMYALKKDGSLWINRSAGDKSKFIKFDHEIDCATEGKSFCKKLKRNFNKMPSQSIYNYEEHNGQKVNVSGSAGTLCVEPEIVFKF